MKELRLSYYKEFRCIGGACTDTCCAGWEIDVDDVAYGKYQKLPGALREYICGKVGAEGESHFFQLQEGRRCPFLNQDNLCDIFIQAGEDYLCDICREHPRFYNWIGSYTEVGLGLCCEEAQRLILGSAAPAMFEETGEDILPEDELLEPLVRARGVLFTIAQNRSLSIFDRIKQMEELGAELQDVLDFALEEELPEKINGLCEEYQFPDRAAIPPEAEDTEESTEMVGRLQQLLQTYAALEALDPAWTDYMEYLKDHAEELLIHKAAFLQAYSDRLYEYEHLMVYFLYRYFLESVCTMDVQTPIWFASASLWVILLCDIDHWCRTGSLTFEKQCEIIRCYSKEIEYCTENVEAVCGICEIIAAKRL